MNWSLLWFVFAGTILGFALSTLWEWLYFRSKRVVIRDARIAELEAALHDYIDREDIKAATAVYNDGTYNQDAARLETEQPENLNKMTESNGLESNWEAVEHQTATTARAESGEQESTTAKTPDNPIYETDAKDGV